MASSSNNPEVKHDVFLSFRGEDTRKNFKSHLEAAFRRVSIKTFIDDELDRGEEISPSLLKAIEQSKISVIILSENYASSRWCLEELAKILDCEKSFGQKVIPIFYHVDPSHVRNQTGAFGAGFAVLEKRFEERLDALQRWKTALEEVANLSGWTTDSKKDESVLIEEIIMDILKRLNKMSPSDHSDLIGVEPAIKEIESLLQIGSNDVRIVGIWGIGGIGKTSISRAIFNEYWRDFEGSYFAENVREELERRGLTFLREELLCKILEDRYANIGLTLTTERLARKKVFIVFDDVTSLDQIKNLIGDHKYLGLGSRIIITSRDKQVLNNICEPDKIYKLEGLFYHEAFQLFSRYAFRHNGDTIEEYMEQSKRIVTYAKGVPLALKVLGSDLLGKTKQEWKSALNKLERSPPKDIQSVLKISFDSLDYEEKELFLDIACIFKGENRDLVICVMDSCGCSTAFGLRVLIDKSLVIESYDNEITMHDLLEEMGREIVRQESIEDPGKRSRLFHHEDIYRVLTRNKGTEAIKSICLDVSRVGEIHLAPHVFSKMPNLKYLKVYSSHYGEGFNKLYGFQDSDFEFLELKYLSWPGYAWTSLPSKFHPKNLVASEMPAWSIEQLWLGVQDQSAIEDMVKNTLENIRRLKLRLLNPICVPGSSIPEWFTFRSKGSSIELPPGCSNYDPVGFSLCVVISPRDDHNKSKKLTLHYGEYCKADGAQYEKWCGPIVCYGTHPLPPFIDSDHIVFGYMSTVSLINGYTGPDFSSGVLYQFYMTDEKGRRVECYEVKECGILLDPPLVGLDSSRAELGSQPARARLGLFRGSSSSARARLEPTRLGSSSACFQFGSFLARFNSFFISKRHRFVYIYRSKRRRLYKKIKKNIYRANSSSARARSSRAEPGSFRARTEPSRARAGSARIQPYPLVGPPHAKRQKLA